MTNLEWLRTPPRRHAPSTLAETLSKIRSLKELMVHQWALDAIAFAKQQAYAAHVQLRRPSMTLRIERNRQDLEIVCFLRVTLLELTDTTLLQANRRSQQLFREAAQRVQTRRSGHNASLLRSVVRARAILADDTRDWRERVLEARAALADIDEANIGSFAGQVRRALAEDSRRVHACLAGLSGLDFSGAPEDRGFAQWQAWSRLQDSNATGACEAFGAAVPTPPVGAAWSPLVHDLDPKSGYRAFEACALMSLRRSLRRGSVWVDHSIVFRDRKALLLGDDEWTARRDQHLQILGQPAHVKEFMAPILAGVSAGLYAVAEAVDRGRIEIGGDRLLHIPALGARSDDTEPRKTREAIFQRIGDVQLPDILLEVDAATHFSEELLARRASSGDELFALYGALLAHGTDNDAKGVSTMIPGIEVAQIAAAMRALEQPGRLRRASDCVAQFQSRVPISALWGDGDKGSADMMALDASRHLWTSRVDPRRRTYAAGIYTHVRDRWGIFYDQPIVLNERQAGVAVEGVEQQNRSDDRIRISLIAVDTHGFTSVAMAIAKLLGFDLCARLRNLRERKLFMPRGWPVPPALEAVTVRQVSLTAIERGWDDLLRLAASIRSGRVSAALAIQRLGSAAIGDPLHRAAEHLGRLLRTLFLCDYLAIDEFRREIHTLLDRGESVHQLQRAIYTGKVAPERGRRRDEMVAISGSHALLTNIVLAWNTSRMNSVVDNLRKDGVVVEDDWLRRIGPPHFGHINFRGTFSFALDNYADVLIQGRPGRERVSSVR
jgi:TnpA family transposase